MKIKVTKSKLGGNILIPASKSHTIRAVAIAALADGESVLRNPLESADALSAIQAIQKLGATVEQRGKDYIIQGFGINIRSSGEVIDVGNSGTTLRILTAAAALSDQKIQFDGDASIRQRPMGPLFSALRNLGAKIESTDGKCPFTIQGPISGGVTEVEGISSQFLSALLLACPLAEGNTEITPLNLHEKPYVEITLDWLKNQAIQYENDGLNKFYIKGGQQYKAFDRQIPADFSSATFALCAAAITKGEVLIQGLDFSDSQGDKVVFEHLEKMGAQITKQKEGVLVKGGELNGTILDLNATPDALPALAVVGAFAKGETRLINVAQARLKECDRIKAMFTELSKMGADIEELEDGLIIRESKLKPTEVHGYDDHRMVMALSIAGMGLEGKTCIDTAEAVDITYPTFVQDFKKLGANMNLFTNY